MYLERENYDIIIQAGQSNSYGYGIGEVERPYKETENIVYLCDRTRIIATENGLQFQGDEHFPYAFSIAKEERDEKAISGNFALRFAERYVESGLLDKNRKLLIVRTAVGGTGFKRGHWGLHDCLFLRLLDMVDYALSLNEQSKVVGFLWHQGEHDAFEHTDPAIYYERLRDLLHFVRGRYGKEIPFIAGDFVEEWKNKNLEDCNGILEQIHKVVQDNERAGFASSNGLRSNNQAVGNGDELHFCRQALYELGERYFDVFMQMVK